MQPIQKSDRSKIDPETLVVEVMHNGPTEKVETAMNSGCFNQLDGEEGPPGGDVYV